MEWRIDAGDERAPDTDKSGRRGRGESCTVPIYIFLSFILNVHHTLQLENTNYTGSLHITVKRSKRNAPSSDVVLRRAFCW